MITPSVYLCLCPHCAGVFVGLRAESFKEARILLQDMESLQRLVGDPLFYNLQPLCQVIKVPQPGSCSSVSALLKSWFARGSSHLFVQVCAT